MYVNFLLHCGCPQDFERHEEERSDFLKDHFLKYIDLSVEIHEVCAEVSYMRTRPHCMLQEQSTHHIPTRPGAIGFASFSISYTQLNVLETIFGW